MELPDILKLLLPVLTFGLGYLLNFLIERRKWSKDRLEKATLELVRLMNEWHMALTELLVASRDNDVEALKKALNTYRLKSSIGRSVRFHLRYLSKYKRARELANAAANTIIYDKRKPRLPIDANFAMLEEWLNVFGHQLGSMAPRPFYDMNDARSKEDMLRDMQGFSRLVGPYYSWFEQHLNSFLIEAGDLVAALK